jgi:hypothetical protein
MPENGIVEGVRFAIVHKAIASANAPERSRAHSVSGGLPTVLHYTIAGSHIM